MSGILYLHGFRSAPQSFKARLLAEAMAARGLAQAFHCPALSFEPRQALAQARAIVEANAQAGEPPLTLVGSSLGGFYATWLAEHYGLRAVLVNPAVVAPLSLEAYLGPQTNLYTGEVFDFTRDHVAQLAAMTVDQVTPALYFLLLATGDEVLDYRHALARYGDCRRVVRQGDEHGFKGFAEFIPQIFEFAGL